MRIKQSLFLLKVGSDNIVVDPDGGTINLSKLYAMNEESASLWNHFKEKDFTLEDMVEFLCNNYKVEMSVARDDVEKLLIIWKEFGMVL